MTRSLLTLITSIGVMATSPGAELGYVSAASYGAKGDGTTDDTAAIQLAIKASIASPYGGKRVVLPPGTFRITSTLVLIRPIGVIIEGAGKWATKIVWDGTAGQSVIRLYNARDTVIRDMYVEGNAAPKKKPDAVIEVQGDASDRGLAITPSNCVFENLNVGGGNPNSADYGIKYTYAAAPNNNDQGVFRNVAVANTTEAGWWANGANEKNFRFYACVFTGGKRGLYAAHASFHWFGGVMSGHTIANVVVGTLADASSITGLDSETSNRLVYVEHGNSNMAPLTIEACRYSSYALNADGFGIYYMSNGPLTIRASQLGTWADPRIFRIKLDAGGNPGALIVEGNSFGATGASTVSPVVVTPQSTTVILWANVYSGPSNQTIAGPAAWDTVPASKSSISTVK